MTSVSEQFHLVTPYVVRELFVLNGSKGVALPKLSDALNKVMGVKLTEHCIRKVLHKDDPFTQPHLYSKVYQHDELLVRSKQHKGDPVKKPRVAKAPANDASKSDALLSAMRAYEGWMDALAECKEAGLSEGAVQSWVDLTREITNEDT